MKLQVVKTDFGDWAAYDADACCAYHCMHAFGQTQDEAIMEFVSELLTKKLVPMPIDECANQLERMLRDAYEASANT